MANVSKNWNPELTALEQQLLAQDSADRSYTDNAVNQARNYTDSKISQVRPESKSAGSLGTYISGTPHSGQASKSTGQTIAGSKLYPTGTAVIAGSGVVLSGTWRCMGNSLQNGNLVTPITIWLRIS